MDNIEVEYKYKGKHFSLKRFKAFCKKKKLKVIHKTYGDHYLTAPGDAQFIRLRDSFSEKEITVKTASGVVRTEINIDVVAETVDIIKFLLLMGAEYSFSIFKNSYWAYYKDTVISFYTVKLACGRSFDFFEIESTLNGASTDSIKKVEKELGLKSRFRSRRSLFEMFSGALT